MTQTPHFTPEGRLTNEGRKVAERGNNLATIESCGFYDMKHLESYPDESIAYIAMQIRRERAAIAAAFNA